VHVRGQIRAWLAVKLAAIDGLQDHLTLDFPQSVDEADLPWAHVWLGNENVAKITTAGKQERVLECFVDLLTADRADVLERAEEIAARVEAALVDNTMGGLVIESTLIAYTLDRSETGAGQVTILRMRLEFSLRYLTAAGNPSVAV
jgi:hypothetical protein